MERNNLCNFERGHHGEHSCEAHVKFGPVVKEMSLKRFLFWRSGGPCVQWRETIYAILVEGIMRNKSSKLF